MDKEDAKNIFQFIFSVIVYYVIYNYFFDILSKIGINVSDNAYMYVNTLRFIIGGGIIYLIYRSNIHASKSRFGRTWILSVIFSVGAFVLLVFFNYLLHKIIGVFHNYDGYGFVNYFNSSFTMESVLTFINNVILIPFIVIVIFPLGVSNIVKNISGASMLSGVLYGITCGLLLHTSIESAFYSVLIPSLVMMLITYLYKANQNIWMLYVSYVLYIGFGFYVLRYFV